MPPQRVLALGAENFDDAEGRLADATAASLTHDLLRNGSTLNLTALAPQLMNRTLLIVTATRDDPDDQAGGLIASLKRGHDATVESTRIDTDHGFNDHRIALEVTIVRWLARLGLRHANEQ